MARYSMLPVELLALLALLPLALARPEDAVSAARPRRPTSAPAELQNWTVCEEQCAKEPCSQCDEEDIFCPGLCEDSCVCGCAGHPAGSGNYTLTVEYMSALEGCSVKCVASADECARDCRGLNKDCENACWVDKFKCDCDCLDEAQAAVTPSLSMTSCIFGGVLFLFITVVFVGLTWLKINNKK
ncbi:uncharacterized protein LOC113209833 [Frankliniella occidentalis]|uniref:Uncharacterized protein LOC113209833 n=1 Tax=Frankliniella occidentalis TaxID=133901 RepID=A0A6J1SR05_FRAOC|nr:uncharacterized protein LOC113209833 [Frankliniella occidentalis]